MKQYPYIGVFCGYELSTIVLFTAPEIGTILNSNEYAPGSHINHSGWVEEWAKPINRHLRYIHG